MQPILASNLVRTEEIQSSCTLKDSTSSIAFDTILSFFTNEPNLNDIAIQINRDFLGNEEKIENITTSCIVNLALFSILFLGIEKTRLFIEILYTNTHVHLKSDEEFLLHNILSGYTIRQYNLAIQSQPYFKHIKEIKSDNSILHSAALKVSRKIEKFLNDQKVSRLYNYNKDNLLALENEIKLNHELVNPDQSFVYLIASVTLEDKDMKEGSKDELLGIEIYPTEHAFVLEQFLCPIDKKVKVRLYQACLDEFTFVDYIDSFPSNGCMNEQELHEFFDNLRGLYICHDDKDNDDVTKLHQYDGKCFGIKGEPPRKVEFRKDINVMTGVSFRYLTAKINPADCELHVQELRDYCDEHPL